MKLYSSKKKLLAGFCLLASANSAQASFNIDLNFTGGLSAENQSYFTDAANFWDSIITGYAFNTDRSGITINVSVYTDAVGGTLASGGPSYFLGSPATDGHAVVTGGTIDVDTADLQNMLNNGTFLSVIEHEMAHVLGFGTLWEADGIYAHGSGQYTGAFGLAAYRAEFGQPSANNVPVELAGGAGTADGHWNEVDNGSGNTGITDSQGRDMRDELMTGWLNTPASSLFLSNTSIQSFRDLGYTVAAVPLPAAVWLFGSALIAFMGFSVGKRRN